MTKQYLCIYHANCADGITAAWVVRQALGEDDVEFVAADYYSKPVDVADRHVIMVDFSYKAPVIRDMGIEANSILILDHHQSAQAELAEFISENPSRDWHDRLEGRSNRVVACEFDMKRSGAGMAWDFFFAPKYMDRPAIVTHVEDRDLWKFEHPDTRAIHAYLMSYEQTFENWDKVSRELDDPKMRQMAVFAGEAIDRSHLLLVEGEVAKNAMTMVIGGYEVPAINLPYHMASDAAGKLAENAPFGVAWFDGPKGRKLSLRVRNSDVNVGEIAASYGGGGHAKAASFTMERGWPGEDLTADTIRLKGN
jgi:uncharacterized protein